MAKVLLSYQITRPKLVHHFEANSFTCGNVCGNAELLRFDCVFVRMSKFKRFVTKIKSNKMTSLISLYDTSNMIHIIKTAVAPFYKSADICDGAEEIY